MKKVTFLLTINSTSDKERLDVLLDLINEFRSSILATYKSGAGQLLIKAKADHMDYTTMVDAYENDECIEIGAL